MPKNETAIKKFRKGIILQLEEAKKQRAFWIKKAIALEGSLAACDCILTDGDEKSGKVASK